SYTLASAAIAQHGGEATRSQTEGNAMPLEGAMIAERMRRFAQIAGIAGVVAASLAACGDDNAQNSSACSEDSECDFGLICGAGGTCVELPCTSSGDCLNGGQACVSVSQASVCAAVECGCANCSAC